MRIHHLLALSLMLVPITAHVHAQSNRPKDSFFTAPLMASPTPSADSRTHLPTPIATPSNKSLGQLNLNFTLAAPQIGYIPSLIANQPLALHSIHIPEPTRCYLMRSYRFQPDGSAPDATKLAEYSACRPATQFLAKNAASSLLIRGR